LNPDLTGCAGAAAGSFEILETKSITALNFDAISVLIASTF